MVHSVSVPVALNAILLRNGPGFGEQAVIMMPVNLRIVWSDRLVGLRIRPRSGFLRFIRICVSGEIHQLLPYHRVKLHFSVLIRLGYEWDYEQPQYASSYPAGRITMSSRTVSGLTHKLSLYRHSSGALVFGAGTVQWSWGLDGQHWGGSTTEALRCSRPR